MKKSIYAILTTAVLLSISVSGHAQRKVWLIGHRCNSEKMIKYALEDGGNGVEIDISYGKNPDGTDHWCVAHGKHVPLSKCDDKDWMALKTLLNKDYVKNNSKFALLFLDIKTTDKIPELVKYVHQYCPKPQFYIIYGLNLDKISTGAVKDDTIKYLKENLNDHEGFCTQNDGGIQVIMNKLNSLQYPYSQYCYVDGCCIGSFGTFKYVKQAGELRDKREKGKEFCAHTGYWTCQHEGTARRTYTKANCDFAMTECRGLWFTHAWRKCLKNTAIYLNKNGYSIVDNSEKFFWK